MTRAEGPDGGLGRTARAVGSGVLDLAEVEPDFRALGQPGVLAPEIGLLAVLASPS